MNTAAAVPREFGLPRPPEGNETEALGQLARAVEKAPNQTNPIPPRMASASADLKRAIEAIAAAQEKVTTPLMKRDLKSAATVQAALDPS